MSRKPAFEALHSLLMETDRRYHLAKSGYEFDFETEIRPFLEENKDLVDDISEIDTDSRFDAVTRGKVVEEFMELLMSCHAKRFSMKVYKEKSKFINMWLEHARRERLIG